MPEVPPTPPERSPASEAPPAEAAAVILAAHEAHAAGFLEVSRRARLRFETRDWRGRQQDAHERDGLYGQALSRAAADLETLLGPRLRVRAAWVAIKDEFSRRIASRPDGELAETFFNSVTRKLFETVGLDREIEFFRWTSGPRHAPPGRPITSRYPGGRDTNQAVLELLSDHAFAVRYEDMARDAERVAHEADLHLWPVIGNATDYAIEVIDAPFFRNKVAYLVGRIVAGKSMLPLVLPLYHGERGVYVDTVLLEPAEVSIVFSFAFSSFHVEVERHDEVIAFLQSILPWKPLAELYNAIGYYRHGKTELYRDLHRFVHRSRTPFIIAPGKEGAVMIVFTLPDYHFVLKVIKDQPCFLRSAQQPPKGINRAQVIAQYAFVRGRDRVGRLVDTQEFENLRFKRIRFCDALLDEFVQAASQAVSVEADQVVLRHAYVQRRVVPLPLYFEHERDPEILRRVVVDFGWFLKDLAAAGLFPSDLFNIWNYGVTRRRRVVLFDYDDVIPIEQASFAAKRAPRDEAEEMAPEEEWIVAGPLDFFVDEMSRYTGLPPRLFGVFQEVHHDLFDPRFWQEMKKQVSAGEVVDIAPYDRSRRFRRPPA